MAAPRTAAWDSLPDAALLQAASEQEFTTDKLQEQIARW